MCEICLLVVESVLQDDFALATRAYYIYCVLLCCFFILVFPGGPHVAASRRLADINAAAGTPVVRRIDGGGLRARAQDYHSGPWT